MDIKQYELSNGLDVILNPTSDSSVVAFNVWVGVGSADEEPDEAGLAHVHEHMLFKGTERREVGQIAREVESSGGRINAFTSFDNTCYYVVMSSRFFDNGLDILADAVQNSSFDEKELQRELQVIQEEISRGKDNPGRETTIKLFENAYEEHPYRLPIIGTSESVDSFEREDVTQFFEKHYVPDNITLVVSGEFDPDYAVDEIKKQFGEFPRNSYTPKRRPAEPEQRQSRSWVNSRELKQTHFRAGFHIPEATHEEIPALDLLSIILGHGESSHLHRAIYRERELVNSIRTSTFSPKDPGLFILSASYSAESENRHRKVIDEILKEVYRFQYSELSETELERARTIIESQEIYGKQTVEGQAMKLGRYKLLTGDPLYEEVYYEALRDVETDDIRRVASEYLRPENATLVLQYPNDQSGLNLNEAFLRERGNSAWKEVEKTESNIREKTRADSGNGGKSDVTRIELDNGPTVVIEENHRVETFAIRAFAMGGLRSEVPQTAGISSLVANLLTKGTKDREAPEISHAIESMAGSLAGFSGRNTMGLKMKGLSKFFGESFELFSDALLNATFPEEEFSREQFMQLERIKSRRDKLAKVNYDQFCKQFFGDHPYSLPSVGTKKSIQNLDRDDLRQHYRRHLDPNHMVISVAGDIDQKRVIESIEEYLTGQTSGNSDLDVAAYEPKDGVELSVGELDKEQAFISVGFEAPILGDDDAYAMRVLNSILSGQGGRLFYELRDQRGLAYSIFARTLMGLDVSALTIHMGTSPAKLEEAIGGIRDEIERILDGDISDDEMERAKRYLIGSHDIGLQKYSARAKQMGLDEIYGLGYRRLEAFSDRIENVSKTDLSSALNKYIDPEKAVIAVTRPPGTKIERDQLLNAWKQ